jgi:NHLM bacteriocin system ABC transporter peptidase/ATP-binding protein
MEAVECGAASLSMVLASFGRRVPLEELRAACGVSRDGSKASNVLKAARSYGLRAKGFRKEPGDLRELPFPMVVHWNFNHFVVLEGFRKGRAFLNDPATGPRTVTEEEFDQAFTGVALTFERAPEFRPGGPRKSLLRALRARLDGTLPGMAFVVLAGLALVVPGLVVPTFSRIFVDEILIQGLHGWLRPLLLAMGATALGLAALTGLQQHHLLRLETKLALQTSGRFFWHVLNLPIGFFTQRYSGEIGARVAINDRIAQLLSGELATTVLNVVMILFYALLMVQYDWGLTLIGVGAALANMMALRYVSRRRVDLNQRLLQDQGKLMGVAMSGLQNVETMKATGSESDLFARWAGHQAKVGNAQQHLALQTEILSALPPLLLSVGSALVLGLGGVRVMNGEMSMGMLTAFQALFLAFLTPVNRMVALGNTLQEVKGDMDRLDDVLLTRAVPPVFDDAPAPAGTPAKLNGHLELRGVSFGYSPLEPPLIEGFDLVLRPGSRVALVGGSGCGKSTVSKLVCGLYEPWAGEILFDGLPRREIPRAVLNVSLGLVDQEIFLFEDTVRGNVTLWDATLPEADVVQAARDAAIHDDVVLRPGGFTASVEEGGKNFSGGQRQRLEIARALAFNPALLVLDEATSALDTATELAIDDALRRRGCTCLIVAHRLSTIRDCDEIIVMERGKIVQRGTHEEMKNAEGPYRALIAAE